MLSPDKKRLIVYFSENDLAIIDKLAKSENRSRVNFIVNAVKSYITNLPHESNERSYVSKKSGVKHPKG